MARKSNECQRAISAAIYLAALFGLFGLTLNVYPVAQSIGQST
jgi:hypothetical protein